MVEKRRRIPVTYEEIIRFSFIPSTSRVGSRNVPANGTKSGTCLLFLFPYFWDMRLLWKIQSSLTRRQKTRVTFLCRLSTGRKSESSRQTSWAFGSEYRIWQISANYLHQILSRWLTMFVLLCSHETCERGINFLFQPRFCSFCFFATKPKSDKTKTMTKKFFY